MGVTALDLRKEELAKSNSPSPFPGEGAMYVYNPGLGKAGSNLALVTPGEQAQPVPLLRSDPVKEEDGYQLSLECHHIPARPPKSCRQAWKPSDVSCPDRIVVPPAGT